MMSFSRCFFAQKCNHLLASTSSKSLIPRQTYLSLMMQRNGIKISVNRFSTLNAPNKRLLIVRQENNGLRVIELTQRRFFKQKNKFSHQKNVIPMHGIERFLIWMIVSIIFVHVFNVQNIWIEYVPNWLKGPFEFTWNSTTNWLRKMVNGPRVDAVSFKKRSKHDEKEHDNDNCGRDDKENDDTLNDETQDAQKESKSRKSGFRDRKIIEYENRIRLYSTPDKIFRYFASIKIVYDHNEAEIYMTPDDFLRALTPGIKQPDGLGLDQFKKIDLTKEEDETDLNTLLSDILLSGAKDLSYGLKPDSIFYKLSNFGLINFSDFLFLLTVISVSRRHFEIAFRMFDLNGDGNVEYEEFEKVQNAILHQTSIGKKLGASGNRGYKGTVREIQKRPSYRVSSALAKYFFGEDLKQKLTTEKFLDFQRQLQSELLTLEFERKKPNPITGRIKETEFADLLIAYAGFAEKKRTKMIKRVKKKFSDDNNDEGISLDDYLKLFYFLQNINDVDIALAVFHIAGASIDQATLKHVAKTVAHVELRDHLVDVIFTLFDENQDGQLSNREFIAVMKERLRRGLAKPKDTGFMKILHALWNSLKFDF